MANVIHRITKKYLKSVNTPEYPISEWIHNSLLPNCDKKFWVIEGDTVREMTAAEKEELAYSTESTVYLIAEKQLLSNKNGHDYEGNANAIINPVMPACELKYTKVVSGIVTEMTADEKFALDLAVAKTTKQTTIKQQCTAHILAKYPEPIQRSAALGIYTPEVINAMTTFIAGCIAEENRCYDVIEVATIIEEIDVINPTFPS